MDQNTYYNSESCSTFSDDSYQSSPITSARIRTSRDQVTASDISQTRQNRDSLISITKKGQQKNQAFSTVESPLFQQQNHRHSSIQRCHGVGAGARHIFTKKTGGSGGGLTKKVVHAGISRVAIPCHKDRDEMELQYGTILVLHLQCKNIFTMTPGALDPFFNLKNLYLYKNNIRRIQGLDALCNLELLDLSRNNVERIDNVDKCKRLQKLYLGFNEIQVVEGLEGLSNLEELHVDDQDMPPEQPIIFSPGIMASVAHCLAVLDISSNQLRSLEPIADLPILHTLMAADNHFTNFESILDTLESLRQLRFLTLKGNPVASKPNYKSKVIGVVLRLEVLDGKDINDTTRVCVQKLRLIKEYRARQREDADMLSKMRKEQEKHSQLNSNHIDLGNPNEFNFSTPTRCSPLPPFKAKAARNMPFPHWTNSRTTLHEINDSEESHAIVDNSCSYTSRARNSADDDFLMDVVGDDDAAQMSDMAKIIFRLSNLDEVGPGGDGGNIVKMKHANYWEFPGSSLPRECRPLSPLENEIHAGMPSPVTPSYSASAPELIGQNEKRSTSGYRPKPAAPGGRRCSNNSSKSGIPTKSSSDFTVAANASVVNKFHTQRHFHGRTLSPLMELPTPESLTARDEHTE